jgi:hypothetical protein
MEMFGHGVMLEKKDFLTGCIHKKLEHWVMEIKKQSSYQKKFNFLKIII